MSQLQVQYLEKYGELEGRSLSSNFFKRTFDRGLALPLRGESLSDILRLLNSLRSLSQNRSFSIIVVAVINSQTNPSANEVIANEALQDFLNKAGVAFLDGMGHQVFSESIDILWLDRFRFRPFGEKDGVGLARKIGCDILLSLIAKGILNTPFLWTTDADAVLPTSYFDITHLDSVALHYPYRHSSDLFEGRLALTLYEIHLRNYFLGLRWAGSPFAFPSVGSCLAIAPEAYAKVRGFPKRQAGEDFHLLSKLRKLGPIRYQKSDPVVLKGRFSSRVPFGTGQSTIAIHQQLNENATYNLYSPKSFVFLKTLLQKSNTLLASPEEDLTRKEKIFRDYLLNHFSETLMSLELLSFFQILSEAYRLRKTAEQRIRHFHTSFDALKTLRLVHLLEDNVFPSEPWEEALQSSPFLDLNKNSSAAEFLEDLQRQEEHSLDSLLVAFPES